MKGEHQSVSVSDALCDPEREIEAGVGDGSNSRRTREAFLAAKRDELLIPTHAIVDVCERMLTGVSEQFPDDFVADLRVTHSAGHDLLALIDEVLSPLKLELAESDDDFEAVRSRARHDMLNTLNPVINYSEMWLEDAAGSPLEDQLPDLQTIYDSGKRCVSLIERISELCDSETTVPAVNESGLTSETVSNIFGAAALDRVSAVTGKLLVVDDNKTNCEILQRRLEREDHRVSIALNGAQALEMISQDDFDLVLLDIVMPEMDGFEVLLTMKQDERLREIPVIMISALDEIEVAVRCIEAGAEDYLSKPFNLVLLRARIGACLEKKRLHEREVEHLRDIEHQKRRADELLHVILPTEIVSELKTTNSVVPRRYENVAVLFADLVNFTWYCDRNPAEEVVARLQKLVIEWENAAVRHRVEKIKTIGDSFMAASGLLKTCENPVLNCVRCGLDMIEATSRLTKDWALRIGIHSGPDVAGVLGQRQYLFDLWGDTVNTASRVESHGAPGAITLSPQAWHQIQPFSTGMSMGSVPVKGKGMLKLVRFDQFDCVFS